MTTVMQDIPDLIGMSDEGFTALIDQAVRGDLDDSTVGMLKDPKVIDRAYLSLVTMKKSVEGQLAAKRSDYVRNIARYHGDDEKKRKIEDQYRTWRGGALRFKSGVETWLMMLRQAKLSHSPGSSLISDLDKQERYRFMTAYENLCGIIAEHRDHVCGPECDDDQCLADVKLWRAVER